MKKCRKYIVWLQICFAFLIAVVCGCPQRTLAARTEFAGSRSCAVRIDSSDLENYIEGGRESLVFAVRKSRPEWLQVDISRNGQDVIVSLDYSFDSYEDYWRKTKALQAHPPYGGYDRRQDVFVEYGAAPEMFGFLRETLETGELLMEKDFFSLFRAERDELTVADKVYEADEVNRADEVPEADDADRADDAREADDVYEADSRMRIGGKAAYGSVQGVAVHTWWQSNGKFRRDVTVTFPGDDLEQEDIRTFRGLLREKEADVEESSDEGQTEFRLEFEAEDWDELTRKTGYYLEIPAVRSEAQRASRGKKVSVIYTELLDVSDLLTEEGTFLFVFELPKEFQELNAELTTVEISDRTVTGTDPRGIVQFSSEQGFRFDKAVMETDLSGPRTTKRLILTVPAEVAAAFHEEIMARLERNLKRGMQLRVYDEEGERIYELSFSAWFEKDIQRFMGTVTQEEADFSYERSGIPGKTGRISESFDFSGLLGKYVPLDGICVQYVLPARARLTGKTEAEIEDGRVTVIANEEEASVELTFSQIDFRACAIAAVCGILLLAIVFALVGKLRRLVAKRFRR